MSDTTHDNKIIIKTLDLNKGLFVKLYGATADET